MGTRWVVQRTDQLLSPRLYHLIEVLKMSGLQRSSVEKLILLATMLACTTGAESARQPSSSRTAAEQKSSSATATSIEATRYLLILIDGDRLPAPPDSLPNGCTERMEGGWFEIGGGHWRSADSVLVQCRERNTSKAFSRVRLGRVTRSGDSLNFLATDTTSAELLVERGVIRGDSLYTGGEFFDGPPRVYLKH